MLGLVVAPVLLAAWSPSPRPYFRVQSLSRRQALRLPRMDTSEDLIPQDLSFTVATVSSMEDVGKLEWDALTLPNDDTAVSPFMEWDWIHACEASGCVR